MTPIQGNQCIRRPDGSFRPAFSIPEPANCLGTRYVMADTGPLNCRFQLDLLFGLTPPQAAGKAQVSGASPFMSQPTPFQRPTVSPGSNSSASQRTNCLAWSRYVFFDDKRNGDASMVCSYLRRASRTSSSDNELTLGISSPFPAPLPVLLRFVAQKVLVVNLGVGASASIACSIAICSTRCLSTNPPTSTGGYFPVTASRFR